VGLVLLGAVPVAVLAVLFVYPVVDIVGRGLAGPAGLGEVGDLLGRARIRRTLVFTVAQAAASAGLSLLFGFPLAQLLYRRRFRGRGLLRAVITVPFVLPTVVVGLAFRTLLAPSGPLGSWGLDGSVLSILAAHVCLNTAVVARTVGIAWAGLDDRPADAARTLGAGPVRVFVTVTLRALGPAVAAAGVLVFLFCASSFGIVQILGAGRYDTIETLIYRETTELLDLPAASVLSLLQIVLVVLVLLLAGRLRRRTEIALRARSTALPRVSMKDLPVIAVSVLAGVVVLGPVITLVVRSLHTSQGWSLRNYAALGGLGDDNVLLVPVTDAIGTSLVTAAEATAIAVLLGGALTIVLGRRPRSITGRRLLAGLEGAAMLPLGVSAVTVGFGFLIALDAPPLDLRASPVLVPLAQAMVATPLVLRLLLPVVRSIDPRLRQAAAVLGAPPGTVWRTVDLPLLARAAAAATGFAFAVSLGEFGATSFVVTEQAPTLPVVIARLIARPGESNTGMALAAAAVLALVCTAAVALVDLLAGNRSDAVGGFAG
jgi:thiamine transport system permease protein